MLYVFVCVWVSATSEAIQLLDKGADMRADPVSGYDFNLLCRLRLLELGGDGGLCAGGTLIALPSV